jgi:XTP/dITP diphosphohydrolase
MAELLVATQNRGKFREIEAFLKRHHALVVCIFLGDLDPHWNVPEDGATFLENATKKAVATARRFKKVSLADDSGLLVDALGGEPGVRSARYAGENASDLDRVSKLLDRLKGVPSPERSARFECVMVLSDPSGRTIHETGTLHGSIQFECQGEKGFGFDPVFWIPSLKQTLAELETEEKNRISHRAEALQRISQHLRDFFPKM